MTARNDLPVTHDTFRIKQYVNAVSSKVQVLPLLRLCHNAAFALLYDSSFGPRSNLSLGPSGRVCSTEFSITNRDPFYTRSFVIDAVM